MDKNLNFIKIYEIYKKMEMTGNVIAVKGNESYYFVYNNDVLDEIADIDVTISQYKAESNLYKADYISDEKGKVTVELLDGTKIEGISKRISGFYTGNGYEIKQVLILEDTRTHGYIHLEECDIKKIL